MAVVVAYLALSLFQPFKGDGEGAVQVQIPRGAGLGQIADLLEERGVIADGFFFELRATLLGRREDLKAGSFRLRMDMSYVAALDALAKAPAPDVVRVVVPEGRSRREVKPIADGLQGDYLVATRRSSLLNPRSYGAPAAPAWRASCSRPPTSCAGGGRWRHSWSSSWQRSSASSARWTCATRAGAT